MLGVYFSSPIGAQDERTDVQGRPEPGRGSDDESRVVRPGHFPQRREPLVVLGERQPVGVHQFVSDERQLGERDEPGPLGHREASQPDVFRDVGGHVPGDRAGLGDGDGARAYHNVTPTKMSLQSTLLFQWLTPSVARGSCREGRSRRGRSLEPERRSPRPASENE